MQASTISQADRCTDPGLRRDDGGREPFQRYADDYGTEHLLIDDGGALLESAYPLTGEDPDGTPWSMTYWLPRDAVDEVPA